MILQRKVDWSARLRVAIVPLLFIGFSGLAFGNVKASTLSWTSGVEPIVTKTETRPGIWSPDCSFSYQKIANEVNPTLVCLIEGDGVRVNSLPPQVVSIGSDTNLYRIENVTGISLLAHTKSTMSMDGAGVLSIERDLRHSLVKKTNPSTHNVTYRYEHNPDFIFRNADGNWWVENYAHSSNGLWAVVQVRNVGLFRINTQTFEVKRFSQQTVPVNQPAYLGISDDGKLVMMGGSNVPFQLFEIPDACGDFFDDTSANVTSETPVRAPCPERSMDYLPKDPSGAGLYMYQFSKDGSEISYLKTPSPYGGATGGLPADVDTWVTIGLPGYEKKQIDYLALGDSFSSGEGDAEWVLGLMRTNHYLSGTNVIGDTSKGILEERCHVSNRSYPFLLGASMHISYDRMKSVACSGAWAGRDYLQSDDYVGQNNRLKNLNDVVRLQLIGEGINDFIPGRVQQLEFVEKYKPAAVTLTAGGNDAGFVKVISDCAAGGTCDHAGTATGRKRIGAGIQQQYTKLVQLYKSLSAASPQTKTYAMGYPQFFSDSEGPCALNVRLDKSERIMVREAVAYMNNIIEAAAKTAGIKYIDVEDSFGEHTLCGDGEAYVTGLARSGNLSLDIPANFGSESFHPNALGHQAMADRVSSQLGQGKTFLTYNNCTNPVRVMCPNSSIAEPALPAYFADAMAQDSVDYKPGVIVDREYIQKDTADDFNVTLTGLEPGATAQVQAFSDPMDLGSYTADNEGTLAAHIAIPSTLPAGMHTLQVSSKTYSGESVTYWQIIEVRGAPGDIDEDGVPDATDGCYTLNSGVDNNEDGVNDKCDASGSEQLQKVVSTTADDRFADAHIQNQSKVSNSGFGSLSGDTDAMSSDPPVKAGPFCFAANAVSANNWQSPIVVGIITIVCISVSIGGYVLRKKLEKDK